MTPKDRDALTRALVAARTLAPEFARAVESQRTTSWREAAEYAAYHCQVKSLQLRPWQAPPMRSDDVVDPAGMAGGRPEEVALRRRLLAAGLSEFEPDPLAAIEAAERAKAEAEADPQPAV